MIIWFLTGCIVGIVVVSWTNGNSYEKGYEDGRRFERWLRG